MKCCISTLVRKNDDPKYVRADRPPHLSLRRCKSIITLLTAEWFADGGTVTVLHFSGKEREKASHLNTAPESRCEMGEVGGWTEDHDDI